MAAQHDELIARDLSVLRGRQEVLTGLDFTLRAGDAPVGLIGESATGKSTLARALMGVTKPSAGTVTFNGRKVTSVSLRDKKYRDVSLRFVSQNGAFTPSDSLMPGSKLIQAAFTKARRAGQESGLDLAAMLTLVGLAPHEVERPINNISGGQRQRLALAIALATRPKILIPDEPVTALDEPSRRVVMRDVSEWVSRHGIGLLLISHDLLLIEQVTATTHVLADGKIVASGPLRELLANPSHPVTRGMATALPQTYMTASTMAAPAE